MNNLPQWFARPFFQKERNIFLAWMISGIVYALVKFFMGKYNNFNVFKYSIEHAVNGLPLYIEHPQHHYDFYYYGPIFSALMTPFYFLPDWFGMVLWVSANTIFLFYAVRMLPLGHEQKMLVYWYALCELMSAQEMQQFNISVAAIIILSFVCIERKKEFWAAALIVVGTLMKLYPVVGLVFFLFSKRKLTFIASCIFWTALLLVFPITYMPGADYLMTQYTDWIAALGNKNEINMFAGSQNLSLLGVARKISGCATYNDLWLIIPGLILTTAPYLRIKQYGSLRFRLTVLANLLLFVVLFSTGTEGCGYILAMIGIALWYINSPSQPSRYKRWLFIATLVIVGLSTTELVPSFLRKEVIYRYAIKAWPCIIVWGTMCYEMLRLDFREKPKM